MKNDSNYTAKSMVIPSNNIQAKPKCQCLK